MNSVCLPSSCIAQAPSELNWACRHRTLVTGLLLMLAAWALYLPSAWYDFVHFDDVRLLRDQPDLFGQPNLSQDMKAIFVTALPREEPLLLRDVSWAIDSRVFGFGNPIGYHLVNVLLHGVVVGLLFAFVLQMTRRYLFALATAVGWLLLAVHTEPVAWIMGRKDILSTLFMLLALCAQTRRLSAQSKPLWWLWYIATFVFVLFGLLSKVSVLTFPLVLLLHAIFLPYLRAERGPDSALPSYRKLAWETVLTVPNFAASASIYVWYGGILTQMGIFDRGYNAHGFDHFWNVVMLDPLAFWMYLKQLFLPSCLSVLYAWPAFQQTYSALHVVGATATVALLVVAAVWLLQKRKDLFFYYAAFFILMVPYMNLAYMGFLVADRYIYFAALFPLIIAVSLVGEALQRPQSTLRIAALTLAAIVAADNLFQKLSYQPAWRNAETLWQYHVALPRPSPESFANLAAYYYSLASTHQSTPEADLEMRKMSVVVEAGLTQLWRNRQAQPPPEIWNLLFLQSIVQEVNGSLHEALNSLLLADQLRPRFDSINLNLARLYRRLSSSVSDEAHKQTYSQTARDRFALYIQRTFRGRTPPLEVSQEMAAMEDNYRLLTSRATRPNSNPSSPRNRD